MKTPPITAVDHTVVDHTVVDHSTSDPSTIHRRRHSVVRAGGAMTLAVIVQAIANLGFHGTVSRALPATDYGTLGALLTLVLMLTVPLGSVQVAVATTRAAHPDASVAMMIRRTALAGLAGAAVMIALAGPITGFLHLEDPRLALLIAPYVLVATLLAVARGLRIGEQRVLLVAVGIGVSAAARVALGLALAGPLGVAGALWATLAAEVIGLVLIGRFTSTTSTTSLRLDSRHLVMTATVVAGLWLFTGVDTLLARHHLTDLDATAYVAAGTIARTSLAIPLALVTAALATFTLGGNEARKALRMVLAAIAIWGAVATGVVAAVPSLTQRLLFGTELAPNSLVIGLTAVAGISGLVTALTYFHLAQRRRAALWAWAGAGVQVLAIAFFHDSTTQILWASAGALAITIIVSALSTRERTAPTVVPSSPPWTADTRLWQPAGTDLTVVVPFYNPGASVGTTVSQIVDQLRAEHTSFEVIAVSDGSTDGSERHVAALAAPEVRLIVQPVNGGKGSALQRGFASAQGRYVAFIDADGDIDPGHLVSYLQRIRTAEQSSTALGPDIVYASKRHPESTSFSSPFRKMVSWGFIAFTTGMFRLGVADTQTGCKLIRREVLADVLPLLHERRFALDLELFVVARRRGHLNMLSAPVHLGERLAGSTVTAAAIVRTLRDSLTIWVRLHLDGAYPRPAVMAATPAVKPTVAPAATADLVHEPVAA